MAEPDYALKIFFLHFDKIFPQSPPAAKTFLEMGPGDSVASALCAASVGTAKIYLVDIGHFATHDMAFYRRVAGALKSRGLSPPEISEGMAFEEMLNACNAEYLTDGLASLREIPDGCIDYAWSHSMMEHVRKHDFNDTVGEHYRIMKKGGCISHNIDLQDHLGGRLNNLRFSEGVWESDFMAESGFYTNRLRASEIIRAFERSGFHIREMKKGRWPEIPTPRTAMHADFRECSEDDLLTRTLSAIIEKP